MLGMAANTKLWTLEEIFVCASYLLHLLVFFLLNGRIRYARNGSQYALTILQ